MILQVDMGNTRVKWRVIDEAGASTPEGFDYRQLEQALDEIAVRYPNVSELQLSCVASRASSEQLVKGMCCRYPNLRVYEAKSEGQIGNVKFAYSDPGAQGVDRCLAMLAARNEVAGESAGVTVIDAGSALTVDVLNAQGEQVAGYICPGYQMMRTALLGETSNIASGYRASQAKDRPEAGLSTQLCVDRGVLKVFLESVRAFIAEALAVGNRVLVTGGDGRLLMREGVVTQGDYRETLVFDGLALAANIKR